MPTATAWHGPQGGIVDLRGVLVQKGSSLLHYKHPKQVNAVAKLNSLRMAVNCAPGRDHKHANRLGDGYCRKEAMNLLEAATSNFEDPILALKKGVEDVLLHPSSSSSSRFRASLARQLSVFGASFYVDNVGLVSLPVTVSFYKIFTSTNIRFQGRFDRIIFYFSWVSDSFYIQPITARNNWGLDNANRFMQRTMILVAENRVASAHLR